MSRKDQIFWGIWAAVILGAGAAYYLFVDGMRSENELLIEKKVQLASRFMRIGKKKRRSYRYDGPDKDFAKKLRTLDGKLKGLYPLTANLGKVPNDNLVRARREEDGKLSAARKAFVAVLTDPKTGRSFKVDTAKDFTPKPPALQRDPTMALFRQWVQHQQEKTDRAFKKAGKGIQVTFREAKLLDPASKGVRWLDDGRVNGYIESAEDRNKVLYRLLLRRKILMAIARSQAVVWRRKPRADGRKDQPVREPRRVGRIIGLRFVDEPGKSSSARPYVANRIELTVSCHLAVVPALLRELESIGSRVIPGKGGLEQERPFAFWVDELRVKRPRNWPETSGSGEINTERLAEYGRYLEWPVTAFISGTVPEFKESLDPEPRDKAKKRKKK